MVLLIGEAPSREMQESGNLEPLVRADLADLAGVSLEQFLAEFERVNLLETWPGASGRGSAFPMPKARNAAFKMAPTLRKHWRVVLLGKRVANAFGIDVPWHMWFRRFGTQVAVTPHPSKLSRWWNDPAHVAEARRFWRDLRRQGLPRLEGPRVAGDLRGAVPGHPGGRDAGQLRGD